MGYTTEPLPGDVDWDRVRALQALVPREGRTFEEWYPEEKAISDRGWVAYCMPQFDVWNWTEEQVAVARKLLAGVVCGVCARANDPGCALGC